MCVMHGVYLWRNAPYALAKINGHNNEISCFVCGSGLRKNVPISPGEIFRFERENVLEIRSVLSSDILILF